MYPILIRIRGSQFFSHCCHLLSPFVTCIHIAHLPPSQPHPNHDPRFAPLHSPPHQYLHLLTNDSAYITDALRIVEGIQSKLTAPLAHNDSVGVLVSGSV
jgi:hypothetical protein